MEKLIVGFKTIHKKIFIGVFIGFVLFLGIYKSFEFFFLFSTSQDNSIPKKISYGRFPSPIPTQEVESTPEVTLIFTGDVIPARSVNSIMTEKNDFTYPFLKTHEFLKTADLTIINLESPLTSNCPVINTGMVFCGNQRFIEGLLLAGVDIASLSNNHAGNYGKEGVDETVLVLKQNAIEPVGIDSGVYKEVNGVRFAFLGYNGVSPFLDYINTIDKEKVKKDIKTAKQNADVIIVLYHWGAEYSPFPILASGIAPDDPTDIAHFTIDNGADLVVGNHPHWVQGYEEYKGKMIFYALGNFIFDQMWSYETQIGVVLKTTFKGKNLESFELFPIKIENYSQPYFLEGEDKENILNTIKSRSVIN